MGKRSNFERVPRDLYQTPYKAVLPLKPFLPNKFVYCEPFAGEGKLIRHLDSLGGTCLMRSDIEPLCSSIPKLDFFDINDFPFSVITNPPWDRKILHPTIDRLLEKNNTFWLLFDADWMHTKQSSPYMAYCRKIVSVGRVKWIEDSSSVGKDNCCWYQFSPEKGQTEFYGR